MTPQCPNSPVKNATSTIGALRCWTGRGPLLLHLLPALGRWVQQYACVWENTWSVLCTQFQATARSFRAGLPSGITQGNSVTVCDTNEMGSKRVCQMLPCTPGRRLAENWCVAILAHQEKARHPFRGEQAQFQNSTKFFDTLHGTTCDTTLEILGASRNLFQNKRSSWSALVPRVPVQLRCLGAQSAGAVGLLWCPECRSGWGALVPKLAVRLDCFGSRSTDPVGVSWCPEHRCGWGAVVPGGPVRLGWDGARSSGLVGAQNAFLLILCAML